MSEEQPDIDIQHDPEKNRFEAEVNGDLAVAEYSLSGSIITFTHTEVPKALEGQGIGGALARYGLDHARDEGLEVVPRCPFIAHFIDENPEYRNLVR